MLPKIFSPAHAHLRPSQDHNIINPTVFTRIAAFGIRPSQCQSSSIPAKGLSGTRDAFVTMHADDVLTVVNRKCLLSFRFNRLDSSEKLLRV
ncbi:hypothetical protein MTP99_000696 [Tenebrio molitor]|nr:hypothetical protein MTP99_000696 [Tenebrio molitor]